MIFQPTHLLLVLVVAILVFGPKKLPEIGKAIGKSISEFKKGATEADKPQQLNVTEQPKELEGGKGQQ